MAEVQTADVPLDKPIVRSTGDITTLTLRKPSASDLRNLSLLALIQMEADAVQKILPRIAVQAITPADVMAMDASDLFSCAAEIAAFLPSRSQRTAYLEA